MKVFDCFTFFNELDLLEIRLNELNDVVDYFVIIEGEHTWQNNPKPSYYLNNKDRFKKFANKIIHKIVPSDNFNSNAWHNEEYSWNNIACALEEYATDDDLIMISALDELPSLQSIIDVIKNYNQPCSVQMDLFYYYLNTKFKFSERKWAGTYISKYSELDKTNIYKYIVYSRWSVPSVGNGWHFSFLGNHTSIFEKVHSYSHSEFNHFSEEHYKTQIESMLDPFGRNNEVNYIGDIQINDLPIYVQNNLEKFNKYIRV